MNPELPDSGTKSYPPSHFRSGEGDQLIRFVGVLSARVKCGGGGLRPTNHRSPRKIPQILDFDGTLLYILALVPRLFQLHFTYRKEASEMDCWHFSPVRICTAWAFFAALDLFLVVTRGASQDEINKHLAMGGEMLARGQLQDSLSHYHAAVEGDPSNYLTYFKRGTVYLALAKAKLAVVDFNKVLELKPDFTGARMQRAFILLKQGNLEEARDDFYYVYQYENNDEAYEHYLHASRLTVDIKKAEDFMNERNWHAALHILSQLLEYCPWSPRLRELRSKCYIELNDSFSAILDLKSATKLQSDNTKGYYDLSILHYQIGQPHESLREVRECLKLDPDHKLCFPHYKKVKNVEKFTTSAQTAEEGKDYDTCVKSANKILKTEKEEPMIKFLAYERLCRCYLHLDEITQSLNACEEALRINKSPDVLCDRAEAYINSEMYDDAIRDYQDVLEMTDNYDRAKEGLQRAQKLQKQAEKRDYYKILGVKRTASKKEIIKAYRRAAQQWHPDNFPEGDEKKKAEKKFIDIAAAKEVLTDPEKRQKFDRGEDPLDPESGQHEHFNNFQHFNAFQGGSPFTFRFHFN